jgi:hypothetical protein
MMFLFKTGGSPNISRAAIEITTETCLYNRFDMVGLLSATYTPKTVSNKATLISDYAAEVANRMPTRPVSQLTTDFPSLGLNPANLRIGNATHNTLYGLVVKQGGVYRNYVSDCQTRNGLYPYCDVLVLPSYSTAKSLYAGVALMRLQKINSAAATQLISARVPAPSCTPPSSAVWSDVSFSNALDMATGNYTSSAYESDESNRMASLFSATSNANKVKFAWCNFPRSAIPGSTFVYHTSDTYLLGRGMQLYLQTLSGYSGKDLYTDLVFGEIYGPIGLSPTAKYSRRTFGAGDPQQTFTGWGLVLQRSDVARVAKFLSIDHGVVGSTQMLDTTMLDQALQRTATYPNGLNTNDPLGIRWYQHGFWAKNVQSGVGCTSPTYVPAMSGYGGITVALFPPVSGDGVIYYNFSDEGPAANPADPNDVFNWSNPAIEARKFGDYCR